MRHGTDIGPNEHWEPGDIPADIWDQAVREIDGERGYTLELAPDSIEHRLAYRERAEQIIANISEEDL